MSSMTKVIVFIVGFATIAFGDSVVAKWIAVIRRWYEDECDLRLRKLSDQKYEEIRQSWSAYVSDRDAD